MNRLKKAAVLSELAEKLRGAGSWCGETHLQKATFVLQEFLNVPLDYKFVMYRYGPFSFDLRDELTEMQADGLLEMRPAPPYGPNLVPSEASRELRGRYPKSLATYRPAIEFVADRLRDKWVTDLEALATALYVASTEALDEPEAISERLRELKPHVSKEEAESASNEALEIIHGDLPVLHLSH